jgi:hypothetical protein
VSEEPLDRPPTSGWQKVADLLGGILRGKRKEDKDARTIAVLLALVGILGGVVVRGDARTDRLISTIERQNEEANARNREVVAALLKSANATEEANELAKVTNGFLSTVIVEKAGDPRKIRKRYVPKLEPRSP